MSLAFSAIMTLGALVLPDPRCGINEPSATRSFSKQFSRGPASTTDTSAECLLSDSVTAVQKRYAYCIAHCDTGHSIPAFPRFGAGMVTRSPVKHILLFDRGRMTRIRAIGMINRKNFGHLARLGNVLEMGDQHNSPRMVKCDIHLRIAVPCAG